MTRYPAQRGDELHRIKPVVLPSPSPDSFSERLGPPETSSTNIHRILLHADHTPNDPTIHTIPLLEAFLDHAIYMGASDIHFEPTAHFIRVRLRLDGVLKEDVSFHTKFWPSLCARIKILGTMNIAETRSPQTGRFSYIAHHKEVDARVSSHPISQGENVVIRLLNRHNAFLPLDSLGFNSSFVHRLKRSLQKPEGLFIVTGPTGAGKTTTLYSLLTHLNEVGVNIMTLEQPIEYELPMIRQTDIREDKGMSFSEGIRSILRQDPDIIFIGEIRDSETAHMALRAAMTGHRVLTTLHTNSALGSLQRLADLGISPLLIPGNIIGLMAQRLVRQLCPLCKVPRILHQKAASHIGLCISSPITIYEPIGCSDCHHTGYTGRLPIAEYIEGKEIPLFSRRDPTLNVSPPKETFPPKYRSLLNDAHAHLIQGDTDLSEIIKTVDVDAQNLSL